MLFLRSSNCLMHTLCKQPATGAIDHVKLIIPMEASQPLSRIPNILVIVLELTSLLGCDHTVSTILSQVFVELAPVTGEGTFEIIPLFRAPRVRTGIERIVIPRIPERIANVMPNYDRPMDTFSF